MLNQQAMGPLLVILLGVLCVAWSRWFMPREMARVRRRMAERGRSTTRLDAILEGSVYRFCMAWVGAAGAVAVLFGVVLAIE